MLAKPARICFSCPTQKGHVFQSGVLNARDFLLMLQGIQLRSQRGDLAGWVNQFGFFIGLQRDKRSNFAEIDCRYRFPVDRLQFFNLQDPPIQDTRQRDELLLNFRQYSWASSFSSFMPASVARNCGYIDFMSRNCRNSSFFFRFASDSSPLPCFEEIPKYL